MEHILERILFVEDDEDIREVVTFVLGTAGRYIVTASENGVAALHALKTFQPDIILSDVMMPRMDGVTLLKKLKQTPKLSDIPLVFLTARTQPHDVAHYKALGAAEVLCKPFDPILLIDRLEKIWQGLVSSPRASEELMP